MSTIGMSPPVAPQLVFETEASFFKVKNTSNRATLLAARGVYEFSKTTSVYLSAGHMKNDSATAFSATISSAGLNPLPGKSQTAIMTGVSKWF